MTGQDFTTEDMGEMRRQGDMRAFMRRLQRPTIQTKTDATAANLGERPGHVVGAWPIASPTGEPGVVCTCPACVQLHHNPKPDGFDPLT
ncbi:hypothetical protein ACWGRL_28095 [[Kitasatospora] papulosa]